jgi:outer membrane protein OmpA-like peptidoglycan-associated protein
MKKNIHFLFAALIILTYADINRAQNYQNYDFVPGNELIFEDNFESDMAGEWAAHWDLENGQGAVTTIDGRRMLTMTEAFTVFPLMKNKNYLSNNFSIEFDAYTNDMWLSWPFYINFYDENDDYVEILYSLDKVVFSGNNKQLSSEWYKDNYEEASNKFYHFAIAYTDNQMKIYIGEKRYLSIPNLGLKPVRFAFYGGAEPENTKSFTNVRVANGAQMNLLNALMTDGKFVTYGITFDVNKASLKPESMGTINQVLAMLKEKPDLKLEVGGHTDSDGSDENNLKLSQQRADAVVKKLVELGIDAGRLTAKGYGETKPVADNNSFEGKAKNRRVEFVLVK